jgi:plastocyanin
VPFTGTGHNVSNAYLDGIAFSPPPLFDPRLAYPSDPPGAAALLTPTLHGNGFWNSGGLDEDRATPPQASNFVKFNAPGTYNFVCLIHYPFMHGTVVVS